MAERRMFAKTIIDSDLFLDMPASTQLLYFHLAMRADDDGFVNSPKKIQRMIGCSDDDVRVLISKQFIIPFESGIVVIKHWKIHNYLRSDRYNPSVRPEKNLLVLDENKVYQMSTDGIPHDIPAVDAGKVRLGKVSEDKDNMSDKSDDASFSEPPKKKKSQVPKHPEAYEKIISYLNQKAGTNYRASTKDTQNFINARLAEGYTVENFLTVIDKKCAEWLGTELEKFLRPKTLFGNKFESYLNQVIQPRKQTGQNGIEIEPSSEDNWDDIYKLEFGG